MTSKQKIIATIKFTNIKVQDWYEYIIPEIEDLYARGYLSAKISEYNESGSCMDEEDFREYLLRICEWDIWDKK